jgi:hypothetical protein
VITEATKLTDARITILASDEGATITVHDMTACIEFLEIKLNAEQFCAALGRLGYVHCEAEVRGLEHVGMKQQRRRLEFEIDKNVQFDRREKPERLFSAARAATPDGWEFDRAFNSQGSFFNRDNKNFACTTIRRWVPLDTPDEPAESPAQSESPKPTKRKKVQR